MKLWAKLRLFSLCCLLSAARGIEVDAPTFANTTFDYLVVGGGLTGLVVAARLTEDPNVVVGVIEAGPHLEDNNILIPGFAGSIIGNPTYDWMLQTLPQAELNGRTLQPARMKLLGGCTAANLMAYTRAATAEYDGWETLGNNGWNFDNLLPYMKKAENWTAPVTSLVNAYGLDDTADDHGTSGAIKTTAHANYSSLVPPFFTTLEQIGIPVNHAPLGGSPIGSMSVTVTVDAQNRSRSYAANGYYEPNSARTNLVVLTEAQAVKIDFSNPSGNSIQATGIHYIANGNATFTAQASREVILAAGAVQTPQLLELSGVGNATLLANLGIQSVVDLPGVGENLQDHPGVTALFRTLDNETTLDELKDPNILAASMEQYVQNRTGLLSGAPSTTSFLSLKDFVPADIIQSMKQNLDAALQSDPRYQKPTYSLQRKWLDDDSVAQLEFIIFPESMNSTASAANPSAKFYTFSIAFLHAFSRGTVHINSTDGLAAPVIDPKFLESPGDFGKLTLKLVLPHETDRR
ncbi:hypothetical protein K474DRAFT_1658610 [Panus rudis PR-1116 ss-1]|nr:hypothetical protein K474DRAFT_1658610 [Panus rudis PR-1116 ss-1]